LRSILLRARLTLSLTRPEFLLPFHGPRIPAAVLVVLGAAVASCSNDSTGPATPQFRIDSGAVTLAAPGQRLHYVIQLLTTGGQPMPGEAIRREWSGAAAS